MSTSSPLLSVRRCHDRTADQRGYALATPGTTPVHILEKIVWQKEQEIAQGIPLPAPAKTFPVRDFVGALRWCAGVPALIAEIKKASPSRGVLRPHFDPVSIAQSYEAGGASCLSVLTDAHFFQGGFKNLGLVREAVQLPLLCKEFVIDPVQIDRARAFGADAVLLIVAILSDYDLLSLFTHVQQQGMQALIEVHTIAELNRLLSITPIVGALQAGQGMVGVNNRNLTDFTVTLQTTIEVIGGAPPALRDALIWVSESGLFTPSDLQKVCAAGARAVLVGESLVKQADIALAVRQLLAPHD